MELFFRILAGLGGGVLVYAVLRDAFETIVLPRRPSGRRRITAIFYRSTWTPIRALALRTKNPGRRDLALNYFGPLWIVSLIGLWAVLLIAAFSFVYWGLGTDINAPGGGDPGFWMDVYMSGTTFFTLGMGDVSPAGPATRFAAVLQAGMGLGFLALVIGYVPVLYGAFSRREVTVSLLDARAGSPPTAAALLGRTLDANTAAPLHETLAEFERWASDLLEAQLSYPVLAYYRSQHDRQSWVGAITAVLDTCAVLLAARAVPFERQARLTFAMARHAAIDFVQLVGKEPREPGTPRMGPEDAAHLVGVLAKGGLTLDDPARFERRLAVYRRSYEGIVNALGEHLLMPIPPFVPAVGALDDWEEEFAGMTGG